MIPSNVFNLNKDYKKTNGSLFLQQEPGLLDTINRRNPEIWKLYKLMKSMDWDENEFPFDTCIAEFQTCPRDDYEIMIDTLAWQWEGDSVASRSIAPVVAPFVSSSELWAAWLRISDNEVLHAAAYSEIVKGSFINPDEVMNTVLAKTEAHRRMSTVAKAIGEVKLVGAMLTKGEMSRDDPRARDAIMLFTVTLLVLERIQFMASFAITFAYAEIGRFLPIGKTVQKICAEEFNIHVQLGKEILKNELNLEIGQQSFERIKPTVIQLITDVTNAELNWTNNVLFVNDRQLPGCNAELVNEWILFGTTDVLDTLGIRIPEFKEVRKNPLGYIEDWIDVNKNQASPQEEKTGNYLLGGFRDTTNGKVYSVDDL